MKLTDFEVGDVVINTIVSLKMNLMIEEFNKNSTILSDPYTESKFKYEFSNDSSYYLEGVDSAWEYASESCKLCESCQHTFKRKKPWNDNNIMI